LTDAGCGNVTGLWNDLGKFKTPTLRALAARAPYFHNGIAPTLTNFVLHYEKHLGFVFTDQERADLVTSLTRCRVANPTHGSGWMVQFLSYRDLKYPPTAVGGIRWVREF
jgi:cytochrome c peroxidase